MMQCDLLDRIDWDFPGAGTGAASIHAGRAFPGNFIPQIPGALISILSQQGQLILDPFAGSGTTAVEAIKLGRRCISGDLIKISAHISKAKLGASIYPISDATRMKIASELTWVQNCHSEEVGLNNEGAADSLNSWYAHSTLSQLRYIWKLIERYPETDKYSLELIFADLLFQCASPGSAQTSSGLVRKHHWGWVADNVTPKQLVEHNAIEIFLKRLFQLPHSAIPNASLGDALVTQQDARQISLADESVDLIVTSPPYIGMIDYSRAARMAYMWYGWNLEFDQSREIGARYRRFRKNAQAEYLDAMRLCSLEMHRVLKPNGFMAFVVGESSKFSGTVDALIEDFANKIKLFWGPCTRSPTRRRVTDKNDQTSTETIVVFQKS